MIASLPKVTNTGRAIDYHEDKVEQGKAKFLFDGTGTRGNREELKEFFNEHFEQFEQDAMINKMVNISMSLAAGENLNDDEFKELAEAYLKKMGYIDCPYLLYRHYDKPYEHIHILVTTIDFDGKKIKDFNDHFKNIKVSRELEKEFKLQRTEMKNDRPNAKLTEVNFRKYYLHNAIKKASHAYNSKAFINDIFTEEEKKRIFVKDGLTQQQIFSILGEERFDTLYKRLQTQGFFNSLFKDEISTKLDGILKNVSTLKDFIKECNHQNIYARVLYDRDKKPYIKYGLKDNSFYVKDSSLSARFRFLTLMKSMGYKEGQNLKDFSRAEQFGYIEKEVSGAMKNNNDFESFNKELIHSGIEPIYEESNEAHIQREIS